MRNRKNTKIDHKTSISSVSDMPDPKVLQKIVRKIQTYLLQAQSDSDDSSYLRIPNSLFGHLSDAEIDAICTTVNQMQNIPIFLSRCISGIASRAHLRELGLPDAFFDEHKELFVEGIQAMRVHPSVKSPLTAYKGGYFIGHGGVFLNCQFFVAKVTHILAEPSTVPNDRTESEIEGEIVFYIDDKGRMRTPTDKMKITGPRFSIRYFLGRLTDQELAALKIKLRFDPDLHFLFGKSQAVLKGNC